jgi:hypothetical protein
MTAVNTHLPVQVNYPTCEDLRKLGETFVHDPRPCLPLIGIIFSTAEELSLVRQYSETLPIEKQIELIKKKNIYKVLNIISCLITVAYIITRIAQQNFGSLLLIASLFNCSSTGIQFYALHVNKKIIIDLKTHGHTQLHIK